MSYVLRAAQVAFRGFVDFPPKSAAAHTVSAVQRAVLLLSWGCTSCDTRLPCGCISAHAVGYVLRAAQVALRGFVDFSPESAAAHTVSAVQRAV